jgi:hypothetical protein
MTVAASASWLDRVENYFSSLIYIIAGTKVSMAAPSIHGKALAIPQP